MTFDSQRRCVLTGLGAILGAACLPPACSSQRVAVTPSVKGSFPTLEVGGSHREIGSAMGEHFREIIRGVLADSEDFEKVKALAAGPQRGRVQGYRRHVERYAPQLLEELEGMALGAGVAPAELFAWNCRSELLAAAEACPPGCSTVGWVDDTTMVLAHNEDGGAAYLGRMVMVRVRPPSGVGFRSLVYPGTLPGNAPGWNDRGVFQTTNFIGPCEVSDGVPRYFLGRAVLEAKDLEDAVRIAATPGRAFPWHHNLGSLPQGRLISLETWPGHSDRIDVTGLHIHTNHLTHDAMSRMPERETYLNRSSRPRYEALEEIARRHALRNAKDMVHALSDRSGAPCKVCRLPHDEVPGVTVAAAVFESPDRVSLIAGPPCR